MLVKIPGEGVTNGEMMLQGIKKKNLARVKQLISGQAESQIQGYLTPNFLIFVPPSKTFVIIAFVPLPSLHMCLLVDIDTYPRCDRRKSPLWFSSRYCLLTVFFPLHHWAGSAKEQQATKFSCSLFIL